MNPLDYMKRAANEASQIVADELTAVASQVRHGDKSEWTREEVADLITAFAAAISRLSTKNFGS